MLNEDNIINLIKSNPLSRRFVGDDAATIPLNDDTSLIISKDLLVEDIHFRIRYFSPKNLAHKALHVNLSDMAAMGATPKYVLLGISVPSHYSFTKELLEYFMLECQKHNVILIGGDTTGSHDKLFISVTIIGTANNNDIKLRSTAQEDDIICVAGHLGYAHLGLIALEKNINDFDLFKQKLLQPEAKLQAGLWLGHNEQVTSMMDLSDGLFTDLNKLCKASNKSALIELNNIKLTDDFIQHCKKLQLLADEVILSGGEDYSLLFTVKTEKYSELSDTFEQEFGYKILQIGKILQKSDQTIYIKKDDIIIEPNLDIFSHFEQKTRSKTTPHI